MSINPLNVVSKIVKSYSPLRKNDTDKRNESHYDMVTTYAPALKKFVLNGIRKDVKGEIKDVHILQTHYLHYRNDEKNNNKFHYYALVMFDLDGSTKYVGANVYGRVGFGEKYQNLTKGVVESPREAENAINKHLYSKLQKGYNEIKLRRGSNKHASTRYTKPLDENDESCRKLLNYVESTEYIGKETGIKMRISLPITSNKEILDPRIFIIDKENNPIYGENAIAYIQKCSNECSALLAKSVVMMREAKKLFNDIEESKTDENLYKNGDVYAGTWGYSMVLAKFAVIVGLTPKSIKFQIVGNKKVGGDNFHPEVIPDFSKKTKIVTVRIPKDQKYIKVDGCYMEKWNGKPIQEDHLD